MVARQNVIQYDRKILRIAFFLILSIPVSSVNLLHIGILRKECNKLFLADINCFTGIFNNLYLYVRQRGVKLQNKMDF